MGNERRSAEEAYIWGYPMVDNLRIHHAFFVDRENPEFKAPYNQLKNIPRSFTHEDTAVQTPNSDTPYSWIGLDLRSEPIVFTVPAIEDGRYFSLQLIDLYTHNFAYIEHENSILSSSNVTLNADGTFTVDFGSREVCGDVPNRLDVAEGWNFLMRVYRPGRSILDGTYELPRAVETSPPTEIGAPAAH